MAIFWIAYSNFYPFYRDGVLPKDTRENFVAMAAGFSASLMSSVVAHPFDVFKTLKVVKNKEFSDSNSYKIGCNIIKENGFNGLWQGKTPK